MKSLDIYFASRRFTIATASVGGYEVTCSSDEFITRDRLMELFERHSWVAWVLPEGVALEDAYSRFAGQFIEVVAAGGVVERRDGAILMIHRNGRWDIPKGHWEQGETIAQCAVREVEEESGVGGIELGDKLCETVHAYYLRGVWEIKTTHWYRMYSDDATPLSPQFEEGIDRAEWISSEDIPSTITNSFPTIKKVIEAYVNVGWSL